MTLALEIEYLAGVSFAAIGPASAAPDWPPQPDRVFSALVATWAARGQDHQEAEALHWLENLPAPLLIERGAEPRSSAIVFVPPNDPRSDRQKHATEVLPASRRRQPRRFPAARPNDPILRLIWPKATPEMTTLMALNRLAHDTAYIGHSSSLTRCRFFLAQGGFNLSDGKASNLAVYPGRFRELQNAYARFEKSANSKDRPQKGTPVLKQSSTEEGEASYFGKRWLILEHVDGDMPDLRACAFVAKTIRDALLGAYRRAGIEDQIPEAISGHAPDGAPSQVPHIAIVPLAFLGFPYADGHVMGFAVIPPRGNGILDSEQFRKALRAIAPMDEGRGRRVVTIRTKGGTSRNQAFSVELSPTFEPDRSSLDPALYLGPARTFATATPIALDRHLKKKDLARQGEIETQIAAACRHIGLPEPEAVVTDKHSAIEGAPSAYPSGKSPAWLGWRTPPSLASRQLTHAVIRFSKPVGGPLILGAGRFLGLGICRPLTPEE